MKSGYMYILECADGSYYTGSTVDLKRRMSQHQNFEGSNFTAKKWPVKLVYFECYTSIALAFNRENQVQGWRRAKKLALIEGRFKDLPVLSKASLGKRLGELVSTSGALSLPKCSTSDMRVAP